jgi:hypothetical protein
MDVKETRQAEQNAAAKSRGGSGDTVYFVGAIGAWVYYIGRAGSVREGALGFLKGLVWPALLVHKVLAFLDKE